MIKKLFSAFCSKTFLQQNRDILVMGIVFFIGLIQTLSYIWIHLDPFSIDISGHIASSFIFDQWYFHSFFDGWFGGYVHNLFYPPLEDSIISIFHTVLWGDWVTSFQIYLTVLLPVYIILLFVFSFRYKVQFLRMFFLICIFFYLFANKWDSTLFQWFGIFDVLITGLTSQVLWAIFLLLLLYNVLWKKSFVWHFVFLSLAISSHLIVAPIGVLLSFFKAIQDKDKKLLIATILAVFATSFFWIPFLLSKGILYSSMIVPSFPDFLFYVLPLVWFIFGKDRSWTFMIVTSLILLFPAEIGNVFSYIFGFFPFPNFHYYRFNSPTFFFVLVVIVFAMERLWQVHNKRWETIVLWLALSIFMVKVYSFWHMFPVSEVIHSYSPRAVSNQKNTFTPDMFSFLSWGKRVLTIVPERQIDFYLDSWLLTQGATVPFVKWLFWESNLNNTILSSYLANILYPEALVVDYRRYSGLTCTDKKGFFKNFVRDYAIGSVVVNTKLKDVMYLTPEEIQCFNSFFTQKTWDFLFVPVTWFNAYGRDFTIYNVVRGSSGYQHLVEYLPANTLLAQVQAKWSFFFRNIFNDIAKSVKAGVFNPIVYLYDESYDAFLDTIQSVQEQGHAISIVQGSVPLQKISKSDYRIDLWDDSYHIIKIKMNYFPWLHLINEKWEEFSLYKAPVSMLAVARGTLTLYYEKPWYFIFSYILSFTSCSILLLFLYFFRTGWKNV